MFDTLKRIQLRRKGLSCGKTRRKHGDNDLVRFFRSSPWIRLLIFASFLGGLFLLMVYPPTEGAAYHGPRAPFALALAVLASLTALIQLYLNHPRNFGNNARFLLFFGSLWSHLFLVKAAIVWTASRGFEGKEALLILPMAAAPLVLSVLANRNLGLFSAVATTILGAFVVPSDYLLDFLVMNLACGFTALLMTENVRRRGRLLRAGLVVGLVGTVFAWLCGLFPIPPAGGNWASLWPIAFIPLGSALASALLLGGILPVLETCFQSTTQMSWIESADLNHPLMRRLIEEAPGTYQHSLVVARIAETAAEAIGANGAMCRACAYFHDVGKLSKPGYFIENVGEGENPHDDLTPTMSALVIIAHVKDGVHVALENRLKPEIIDAIEQHHGTSMVYSFYRKAVAHQEEIRQRKEEGLATDEEVPEINQESFRYPGPKPQTRESAILSLADSVESASRSLTKPTPAKIRQLVDDIVHSRIEDGQLDDCDLTFLELAAVRTSFTESIRSMLHSRIAYPDKEKKEKVSERVEEGEKKKAEEELRAAATVAAAETIAAAGPAGSGKGDKGGKGEKGKKSKKGEKAGEAPVKSKTKPSGTNRPERSAAIRSSRR